MDTEGKNSNRGIYKKSTFEMYCFWKYLPAQLRGQPQTFFEKLGIMSEQVYELAQIMSQKEFAEKYGVKDQGTLSDWNKKINKENSVQYCKFWASYLDGTVLFSQFQKIRTEVKGNDVKHWFDIFDNY